MHASYVSAVRVEIGGGTRKVDRSLTFCIRSIQSRFNLCTEEVVYSDSVYSDTV